MKKREKELLAKAITKVKAKYPNTRFWVDLEIDDNGSIKETVFMTHNRVSARVLYDPEKDVLLYALTESYAACSARMKNPLSVINRINKVKARPAKR